MRDIGQPEWPPLTIEGSNYPAHWHKYGHIKERLAIMEEDFSFLSAEDRRWIFGEAALSLWPSVRRVGK